GARVAVRPRPRDVRPRRLVPPRGFRRLRAAVGPLRRDVVAAPGSGRPVNDARRPPAEPAGRPLWHGRFGEGPADDLLAFTVSLPYDRRLAPDDLAGSRAHVHMLERVGLLDEQERQVIDAALDRVEEELASGSFKFAPTDEDIHTAVERRVTEIAGATGAKL